MLHGNFFTSLNSDKCLMECAAHMINHFLNNYSTGTSIKSLLSVMSSRSVLRVVSTVLLYPLCVVSSVLLYPLCMSVVSSSISVELCTLYLVCPVYLS